MPMTKSGYYEYIIISEHMQNEIRSAGIYAYLKDVRGITVRVSYVH
ncbi:hypothetical protein [Bacillus sp. SG-1]|nr:hypothetical protein [Bacillus sp. SG-1]EDL64339.1 hypothetical protein BSG1_14513 [Bacillus sp. SG-1]